MPSVQMPRFTDQLPRDAMSIVRASERDVQRAARRAQYAGAGAAAREIWITDLPVRVTATGAQELRLARDVSMFDELDLELRVLTVEGSTPSVTVEIQTGMQIESTAGWVTVASFTAATANNTAEKRNFIELLRCVRWNVTAFAGTAATFSISGIGRSWT